MIISVLGLAGSGKSTQADLIAKETGFVHISVGQLLRQSHQDHLNEYMKIGKLINPSVVNGLLQEKIAELMALDSTKGIILDGYPRQMEQAEWIVSNNQQYPLKIIVLIDISIEEATKRLITRKRLDDNVEAIKNRLKIFKLNTEPAIEYLRQQGVFVVKVDGMGTIEQTHQKIMEQLKHVLAASQN